MISSAVVNRYAGSTQPMLFFRRSPDVRPPDAIGQLRAFDATVQVSPDLGKVLSSQRAIPVCAQTGDHQGHAPKNWAFRAWCGISCSC